MSAGLQPSRAGSRALESNIYNYHCSNSFFGEFFMESAGLDRHHTNRAVAGHVGTDRRDTEIRAL
jgi:hypothetical protein